MDWSNDKIIQLINAVEENPGLWDVTNVLYKNANKKKEIFHEIGKEIGYSGDEIERKWNVVRGQYRRERRKIEKRKASASSGSCCVYKSMWFAYPYMYFLEKFMTFKHIEKKTKEAPWCSREDLEESSIEHDVLSRDFETSDIKDEPNEQSEIKVRKIDETIVHESRDQYSAYAEHIAHRLRNCKRDDYEIYIAQHNIDTILFNLCMGGYTKVNSSVNGPLIHNEQQTSTGSSVPDSFQGIITKKELDL